MSREKIVVIVALVAFVATGLAYVITGPQAPRPDGRAAASLAGHEDPEAALWVRLGQARAWLPTFEAALSDPAPEARTVLAAFATLADALAGPSGFWRDAVPNELLACHRAPEQTVCRRLSESLPELTDGEALARSIRRLDPSRAEVFLARNAEAMLRWVELFAPSEPSATAMRLTAFWALRLAPAVAGQ